MYYVERWSRICCYSACLEVPDLNRCVFAAVHAYCGISSDVSVFVTAYLWSQHIYGHSVTFACDYTYCAALFVCVTRNPHTLNKDNTTINSTDNFNYVLGLQRLPIFHVAVKYPQLPGSTQHCNHNLGHNLSFSC